MFEYPNIFVLYLLIGHDSVSTGVKIEERIGERFDFSLCETAETCWEVTEGKILPRRCLLKTLGSL